MANTKTATPEPASTPRSVSASGTIVLIAHRHLAASSHAATWFRPRDGFLFAYCRPNGSWEVSSHCHLPTVVVADEESFWEAQGLLKASFSATWPKVLVLGPDTADATQVTQLLISGAMGYVADNSPPTLIREAVRCVAKGEYWASRAVLSQVITACLPGPRRIELTLRELELIERLSSGQNNRAIAAEIGISPETVRWHLRRIYSKLGVSDRREAVEACRDRLARLGGERESERVARPNEENLSAPHSEPES